MTPAVNALKKQKIPHQIHEYTHDVSSESYGLEAAEKLGIDPSRVFKTLVVSTDKDELLVAVIPVAEKLSMKQIAKVAAAKKVMMAEKTKVERSTGYVVGGVSPIGQKKRLKTYIDDSAQQLPTIFISAGRRGLEIELSPLDLMKVTAGKYAQLCQ